MKTGATIHLLAAAVRLRAVPALFLGILIFAGSAPAMEDVIPVASGLSLTIFEQTGGIFETSFSVGDLLAGDGEFLTAAGEKYTVTSDGVLLTILCHHDKSLRYENLDAGTADDRTVPSEFPFDDLLGHSAGNNIVAVRLDGNPDFPSGLWASFVADYRLGGRGVSESRFNALGDARDRGPYGDRHYTVLGSGSSGITLGFSPLITAALETGEIVPPDDILSLYLRLPEGYSPAEIDFHSLELAEVAGVEAGILPLGWWDLEVPDGDGVPVLRLRFSLNDINSFLLPGDNLLLLHGRLANGIAFTGRAVLTLR